MCPYDPHQLISLSIAACVQVRNPQHLHLNLELHMCVSRTSQTLLLSGNQANCLLRLWQYWTSLQTLHSIVEWSFSPWIQHQWCVSWMFVRWAHTHTSPLAVLPPRYFLSISNLLLKNVHGTSEHVQVMWLFHRFFSPGSHFVCYQSIFNLWCVIMNVSC